MAEQKRFDLDLTETNVIVLYKALRDLKVKFEGDDLKIKKINDVLDKFYPLHQEIFGNDFPGDDF